VHHKIKQNVRGLKQVACWMHAPIEDFIWDSRGPGCLTCTKRNLTINTVK